MKKLVLLFLCSILFLCCRHGVYGRLDDAESSLHADPKDALALLRAIPSEELRTDKEKARYALLYSMALDKNYIDVSSDSLISIAYTFYSRKGSPREKMLSSYYLGLVRKNAGDYADALAHLTDAETIATQACDYHHLGLINSNLSLIYAQTYFPQKAIETSQTSIYSYEQCGEIYAADYSRLLLARGFLADYRIEKAVTILDSLGKVYKGQNDVFYSEICLTKARIYTQNGLSEIKEAMACYQEIDSLGKISLGISGMGNIAVISQQIGEDGVADRYLSQTKEIIKTPVDSAIYYNACYNVYNGRHEYQKAADALTEAVQIQNRVLSSNFRQATNLSMESYYRNKMILEREQAHTQRIVFLFSGLIFLIVMVVLISAMIILQKKHRRIVLEDMAAIEDFKKDLVHQKENNDRVSSVIDAFVRDKVDSMHHLSDMYFSWEDQAVLKRDKKNGIDTRDEVIRTFRKQLNSFRDSHAFVSDLEQVLNLTNNDIITRFRNEYVKVFGKELKGSDEDFAILLFSGLSVKSICYYLNMSESAARMRKSRLKKSVEQFSSDFRETCLQRLE